MTEPPSLTADNLLHIGPLIFTRREVTTLIDHITRIHALMCRREQADKDRVWREAVQMVTTADVPLAARWMPEGAYRGTIDEPNTEEETIL